MAVETSSSSSIAPATTIGTVQLVVSNLDRSRAFYEQLLGMRAVERDDGSLALGAATGESPLLVLSPGAGGAPLDRRLTGLYHFAVLVPSRRDLAAAITRIASARWPVSGASDHLVSEALYLDDPDGIGIEIYHDRDRSEWPHDDAGRLQMATLPMDVEGVMGTLSERPFDPEADRLLPAGTRIGHVHLQVSDLRSIEQFYADLLGFDVTVRDYPGALFVSAGGYHHHLGLNTWHSRGAEAPAEGSVGLRWYEVRLPDTASRDEVLARVERAGLPAVAAGSAGAAEADLLPEGSALVRDPSGNGVLLRS